MANTALKQFGVWMDHQNAAIVGREDATGKFELLGHESSEGARPNTSESAEHNDEKTQLHKFFKSILAYMPNAENVHLTGIGTAQEEFKHYMADTPQYKNTKVEDSTSETMSDEKLLEFFDANF